MQPQLGALTPELSSHYWRSLARICCADNQPESAVHTLLKWTEDPFVQTAQLLPNHNDLKLVLRACCSMQPLVIEASSNSTDTSSGHQANDVCTAMSAAEMRATLFRRTRIMSTLLKRFHEDSKVDEEIRSYSLVLRSMSSVGPKKTEAQMWAEASFAYGNMSLTSDWHYARVVSSCLEVRHRLVALSAQQVEETTTLDDLDLVVGAVSNIENVENVENVENAESSENSDDNDDEEDDTDLVLPTDLNGHLHKENRRTQQQQKEVVVTLTDSTTTNAMPGHDHLPVHVLSQRDQKKMQALAKKDEVLQFELAHQHATLTQLTRVVCQSRNEGVANGTHSYVSDGTEVRATTDVESCFAAHALGGREGLKELGKKHVVVGETNVHNSSLVERAFRAVFQSYDDMKWMNLPHVRISLFPSVVKLYMETVTPTTACVEILLSVLACHASHVRKPKEAQRAKQLLLSVLELVQRHSLDMNPKGCASAFLAAEKLNTWQVRIEFESTLIQKINVSHFLKN